MSKTRIACLLVLLSVAIPGFAANPIPLQRAVNPFATQTSALPFYGSVFVDRQRLGIDDSRFTVPVVTAAAGWWGWPGIALELELGKGLGDDSLNNFDLEVFSFSSLNLRLESPPTGGIAAYALFGVSRTNIDSSFSGSIVNTKKNSFRGGRGAIGLTLQMTRQLVVDAAFTHHDYDDDIGINSFRIGLRYDFSDRG